MTDSEEEEMCGRECQVWVVNDSSDEGSDDGSSDIKNDDDDDVLNEEYSQLREENTCISGTQTWN